jgi:hypothetical protein
MVPESTVELSNLHFFLHEVETKRRNATENRVAVIFNVFIVNSINFFQ